MKPNSKQQEVLDEISSLLRKPDKQYLNVVGEGGTGKSWLISLIKKEFSEEDRPVIVSATTGLASSNIGGRTVHSLLGLSLGVNEEAEDAGSLYKLSGDGQVQLNSNAILIVDECSMLSLEVFRMIKKLRVKLVILFGDKQQLPPVKESTFTPLGKTIELTEQMRQSEGRLYDLIRDYREAKMEDRWIKVREYVNDEDIKLIHYDDMPSHFLDNPIENKKVISYTNDEADLAVERIKPKSKIYRLNTNVTVWDGNKTHLLAVNGQEVEIAKFPRCRLEAHRYYKKTYNETPQQLIAWDTHNCGVPVVNAILKDIPALFVKMFLGKESEINEVIERRLRVWLREKSRLQAKYGALWKENKDDAYRRSIRRLMGIKNGVVSARHSCSLTVHKSQGQTIESVYINLDDIKRRDLMYVALSRASKEIVFFSREV